MGWLAYLLGSTVLGLLAVLMLFGLPVGVKASVAAAAFRVNYPDPPADPRELTDDQLRGLVGAAVQLTPSRQQSPEAVATWARTMHGEAVAPRVGAGAAAGFLTAYLLGRGLTAGYLTLTAAGPGVPPPPAADGGPLAPG